ncbi:hypothetical protein HIM_08158 [Hirsutella minnesotensis 3608]|uniref:rRNA methyltransferase 2, mitochondrial n=1 Tax=Hirsutella minnesotensis 3608 TaxID=1043627 RepID=A0A0F8A3V5_9HYPO|nr:hypothetical protein HIM_08158 [Hirsutella minnesotensis 3608]
MATLLRPQRLCLLGRYSRPLLSALAECKPTACPARSSSSTSRWKQRQGRDKYARDAKVQGLKSRAAFKLLEMDAKFRLFKKNQIVVDLGYAPGSWSQVALDRTLPHGQVVGIDLIPAQPPRGVATFQGDFMSPTVQRLVTDFIRTLRRRPPASRRGRNDEDDEDEDLDEKVALDQPSYIDQERHLAEKVEPETEEPTSPRLPSRSGLVDVVLSDMSAPWDQTTGFSANTLSNPYHRLMNTSGNAFRDHAGSMDLCMAALRFASDTLRPGGNFVCKFYQGAEDKALEQRLKKMFSRVHREKPESSRSDSKEAYFVALRRKYGVTIT